MAAPRSDVPLDVLRAALRSAVDTRGLRPVAVEVKMSPTGLEKSLRPDTAVRPKTLQKMRWWYVRNAARFTGATDETARAALDVLLEGVPPGGPRRELERRIAAEIAALHRQQKTKPPEWIGRLVGE